MKKKYVLCPVCQTKIEATSDIGLVCYLCNCLINLNARALNYFNEGGQPLPSKEKSLLRIKDAELRFKLISNKISKDTTTFVDIGCGSGEMLSVAKKYFKNIIGYEHCPILYKYVSNLGYKVFNNNFKANHLNSLDIKKNENILITLNHVLEHNENSIEMINLHGGITPYQVGKFSPIKSIKKGHSIIGATIHELSEEFDSGKIITQSYFKVEKKDFSYLLKCPTALSRLL